MIVAHNTVSSTVIAKYQPFLFYDDTLLETIGALFVYVCKCTQDSEMVMKSNLERKQILHPPTVSLYQKMPEQKNLGR